MISPRSLGKAIGVREDFFNSEGSDRMLLDVANEKLRAAAIGQEQGRRP